MDRSQRRVTRKSYIRWSVGTGKGTLHSDIKEEGGPGSRPLNVIGWKKSLRVVDSYSSNYDIYDSPKNGM